MPSATMGSSLREPGCCPAEHTSGDDEYGCLSVLRQFYTSCKYLSQPCLMSAAYGNHVNVAPHIPSRYVCKVLTACRGLIVMG